MSTAVDELQVNCMYGEESDFNTSMPLLKVLQYWTTRPYFFIHDH